MQPTINWETSGGFKSVFDGTGEAVKTNLLQDQVFQAARKSHDQKATSCGISYANTQLAKHEDDGAPFSHRNKINDQPRDGVKFQTRILYGQSGIEIEWITVLDIRTSKREREILLDFT